MEKNLKYTVVTGIIMANNWDETGKVIGIAIYTNNETVYLVERNHVEPALSKLINQKVEVKGRIRENIDSKKSIAVHSFTNIDWKW